jgi:hypothetical protein
MRRFFILGTAAIALLMLIPACVSPSVMVSSNSTAASTSPAPSARPSPSDMVPRITIQELYKKMQAGADVLVIDGRAGVETEFEKGHIKGAIPVSLTQFTSGWTPAVSEDKEILIYCT